MVFKGITLPINSDERIQEPIFTYVKQNVEANERLGLYSNFVRLSAWTKNLPSDYLSQLARVTDYLEQKGIYLVFTPHNDQRNETNDNRFLPNERDKQTVVDLATTLKEKPNVIIGLWNEPANTTWNKWSDIVIDMYGRLKQVYQGAQMPLVMVPGIDWSSDFRGAKIPMPANSYVIDVHPYAVTSIGGYRQVDGRWMHMIGQVPILITELSGIVPGDLSLVTLQSPEDISNMQRILDIVNAPENIGKIGYAPWRGDHYDEGVRELDDTRLRKRGELLKKDRTVYPQTDFTE